MEETCGIAADLSKPLMLDKAVGPFRYLDACNTYKNSAVFKGKQSKRLNPAFGLYPRLGLFALGALLSLLLVHIWADWQLQTALPEVQPVFQPLMRPNTCESTRELIDYAAAVNGGQVLPQNSSASYHGSLLV